MGPEQQLAFDNCKICFLKSPALLPYDPDKPIFIITDASPVGTSAVLYHLDEFGNERPVFFTSKSLNSAQKNYPHHEREALAIIHAVTKFHKYIFGRKFVIFTDNKAIVSLLSHDKAVPVLAKMRLQRWAVILGAYDYVLKFRKGSDIILADYLSRNPLAEMDHREIEINHVKNYRDQNLPIDIQEVALETQKDTVLHEVYKNILKGWPERCPLPQLLPYFNKRELLTIEQNCIILGERVVIPSSLHSQVLKLLHSGHPGIVKSKLLARSLVWWPEIEQDIYNLLQNCSACQAIRNSDQSTTQSWTKSTRRMQRVHVDFAHFKQRYYLIIVDSYSNWIEIFNVASTDFNSVELALIKFFSVNGFCDNLVSDGGPPFNSLNFSKFCIECGIKHILCPAYHPQSNGLAEKGVQIFKNFAKKYYVENPNSNHTQFIKETYKFLHAFRNTPNSVTKKSPSELFLKSICKTHLTNLNPNFSTPVKYSEAIGAKKLFYSGQNVYVRAHNDPNINWIRGIVMEKVSNVIYKVKVNGVIKNFHVDHMRLAVPPNLYKNPKDSHHNNVATPLRTLPYLIPLPGTPPVQQVPDQEVINPNDNNVVTPPNNPANIVQTPPLPIQPNVINYSLPSPVSPLNPIQPVPALNPIPPVPALNPIQPVPMPPQGERRRSMRPRVQPRRLDL